ncbi:hypothetical protein EV356DRAFT_335942 [Viridothelium virens]|uniref:Uncharacterized protein n=1 Tax=Viridothelium virens TaxID=1048519 RepID=A0A6A6HJC8_VIRVR|nr:hypothetical protein EV356DRAFT_335942 [Viridothelium virens]
MMSIMEMPRLVSNTCHFNIISNSGPHMAPHITIFLCKHMHACSLTRGLHIPRTPDSLTDDQRSVSTNTRTELRFMLQGITEHQKKFGPAQKLLPDEEFGVVHSPISGSGVWFETEDQSPLAKQRDADIDARISRLKSQLLEFELAQAREALDSTSQEQERGFEPIRRRLESGSEQALDQGLEEVTGFETDPRNTCTSQLYRPHNTRLGLDGTDDGTYSPSKSAKDAASTYENDDESSLPQSGQQEFLEHDEHHSVMPLVQLDLESTDQELAGKEFASQISQSRADSKADSVATSSQRAEQNPDEQLTDCWNCLSWLDERETNKQETQDDRHRASPEGQALTSVPVSPNSVEDPQSDQLTDLYKDLVYFGQNEVVANSFPDAQDSRCLDPIPIVENRDRTPWSATKTSTGILLEAFAVQNTGTDGTTAHTDSETAAGHLVCRPPFVALPIFVSRDRPPHRPVMKLPGLTLEQQNYLKIHGLLADQPRINMQDAQKPDPTDTCPYLYWIPRRKDVSPPLTALEARAADDAQFVPPDTSQNERWPNPRQPFHAELLTGAAYFTRWQRWADHIHEGAPWPPVDFL